MGRKMRWFENLSIRNKVMSAFAVVLTITAILGIFAINRLSAVNDSAVDLASNYLVAADALGDVSYNSMRFRQLQAAHILGLTPAAKAKEANPDGEKKSLEDLLVDISINDLASKDKVRFIYSGNNEFPFDAREQWTDSCNLLALKEGVVLGYDRNDKTVDVGLDAPC